MNSIKSKSNNYSLVHSKAVAGVVFVPKEGHFMVYVAWEWEDQAKKKRFAIIESPGRIGNDTLNGFTISNVADFGSDVTHDENIRRYFPDLF